MPVIQAEADSKVDEGCIQTDCQANGLGDQLGKLTVHDLQTENDVIPTPEPVQVENDLEPAEAVEVAEPVETIEHVEAAPAAVEQVLEVQSHTEQV